MGIGQKEGAVWWWSRRGDDKVGVGEGRSGVDGVRADGGVREEVSELVRRDRQVSSGGWSRRMELGGWSAC